MKNNQVIFPTPMEGDKLLSWAEEKNPGQWVDHSKVTGRAAQTIASACHLDPELAYTLGLLHDIGRYEGVRHLHHVIAGYHFMQEKGFLRNARICLTHSFPTKDLRTYSGKQDCTKEELEEILSALEVLEYDDYDKLIHLCDAICLPQGVCLLEVRLVDVSRRYGVNELTVEKWNKFFELKDYFDELCSCNLYDLFYDEIIKTSFR